MPGAHDSPQGSAGPLRGECTKRAPHVVGGELWLWRATVAQPRCRLRLERILKTAKRPDQGTRGLVGAVVSALLLCGAPCGAGGGAGPQEGSSTCRNKALEPPRRARGDDQLGLCCHRSADDRICCHPIIDKVGDQLDLLPSIK